MSHTLQVLWRTLLLHLFTTRNLPLLPSALFHQLWLCPSPVSLHPSLVNVHIQHPPEAEVQIHQVARVQPGQRPVITEGAHSVQQRSQPGSVQESAAEQGNRHPHTGHTSHNGHNGHNGYNGHGPVRPHYPQSEHVGRCFQETVDGQVSSHPTLLPPSHVFSLLFPSPSFRLFSLQPPEPSVLAQNKAPSFRQCSVSPESFGSCIWFLFWVYLAGKHPSKYA